jgi:hypothetical protein
MLTVKLEKLAYNRSFVSISHHLQSIFMHDQVFIFAQTHQKVNFNGKNNLISTNLNSF